MANLSLKGLGKRFGAGLAVDAVDMDIPAGAFLALLGPSGCGKSTLLRLIAGLERPSAGSIAIGGRTMADERLFVPPEERGLGMVFQSYALWPHMTVAGNVEFGLKIRGLGRAERARRVEAALAAVGLDGHGGRRPAQLSGGQRQRVALARCLALKPPLILLDEPLANLDAHLRETMQREFRRIHRETGTTFVYVTHDQAEAMALADLVAVMSAGRLQQVAAPAELYRRPATAMVAGFLGRGVLLPVEVGGAAGEGRRRVELLGRTLAVEGAAGAGPGRLCLRPENVALAGDEAGDGAGDGPLFPAEVGEAVYRGDHYALGVRLDGLPDVLLEVRAPEPVAPGTAARLRIAGGWVLPAEGRAA